MDIVERLIVLIQILKMSQVTEGNLVSLIMSQLLRVLYFLFLFAEFNNDFFALNFQHDHNDFLSRCESEEVLNPCLTVSVALPLCPILKK